MLTAPKQLEVSYDIYIYFFSEGQIMTTTKNSCILSEQVSNSSKIGTVSLIFYILMTLG